MNFFSKIFSTIIIAVLMSCSTKDYKISNEVEQRVIFPQYQISYTAENQKLEVSAIFTMDNSSGIAIRLSEKSSIMFNNKPLKLIESNIYQLKLDTFPKNLLFQYSNDNAQFFENRAKINALAIKSDNTIVISKSTGISLTCEGKEFLDEETIACQLWQKENLIWDITANIVGNQQISITPYMLHEIAVGKYTGYFVREMSHSNIKAMDRGGILTTTYITKPYNIVIIN